MWTIGSFAFAAPWMLLTLAGVPLLWWLLRLTPPAPKRTPLWLIIFRILLATILIIGLAHPLINPVRQFESSGPLLLVVDDGWAAAPRWPQRLQAMTDLIDRAEREERSVMLLTTAPRADGQPIAASGLMTATQARGVVQGLTPQPWATDRRSALTAVERLKPESPINSVWISDGVVTGKDDAGLALADRLQELGQLTVMRDLSDNLPVLLLPPPREPGAMEIKLARPVGAAQRSVAVRAIAGDGRLVVRQDVTFAAGSST